MLGPMRRYSTRAIERIIGFYKQRIKSKSATAINASNQLCTTAAHHHYMHAGDVAQEDENDGNLGSYTITTTEADMGTNDVVNAQGTADSHRLWCVVRDESLKVGQFDAWDLDRYLRQYWKRHLKVRNAISSLRESKIIVGKELFDSDTGTFYGSKAYPHLARKKPVAFVKLSIPVDVNRADPGASYDLVWETYFGICILFFAYTYQGTVKYWVQSLTVYFADKRFIVFYMI